MNLTGTDVKIIVVMSLVVVLMSFVFPALGMTGEEQQQADIPEFDINSSRFDFAGDLPDFPLRPDQGVLNHSSDEFDDFRGSIQTEIGENDGGNRTFLVAIENDTVHMTDVENNSIDATHTFTSNDETATLTASGFEIDVHSVDISENAGEYEYQITQRPGESTTLGSLFNTADAIANVVGYIAISVVVVSQMIVQGAANIGGIIFDVVVFFIDLMGWLSSTYFGIVDAAPDWSKVFLTIPGILLFYEFGKLTIIGITTVKPFS